MNRYTHLSFGELFQSLIDALDHRQCFIDMNDWNMVKAWDEQIDFIKIELRRRGWVK